MVDLNDEIVVSVCVWEARIDLSWTVWVGPRVRWEKSRKWSVAGKRAGADQVLAQSIDSDPVRGETGNRIRYAVVRVSAK